MPPAYVFLFYAERLGQDNEIELMEEQSWLLKLSALELRCLAVANQKSQVSRFVKLLFEESDKPTSVYMGTFRANSEG